MKPAFFRSVIFCLAVLAVLLVSAGCSPTTLATTTEPSQTTSPAAPTQSPTSTMVLPADKLKRWEEEGVYVAETLEEAELVAGYKAATPAFIPDGFIRTGSFNVSRLGARLPENLKPKFTAIILDQRWVWQDNNLSGFMLSQQNHQFGIGNSEPTVIAGKTFERAFIPAEGEQPDRLTLGWTDGDLWYSLLGFLNENLDEATLIKIAESVGVN